MREIDFTPRDYVRRVARRRRVVREFVLLMVLFVGLMCWWYTGHAGLHAVRAEDRKLKNQVAMAEQQQIELMRLQSEKKRLAHEVGLKRELSQPVQYTQLIAKISALLPKSVAILNLEMETVRPSPKTKAKVAHVVSRKRGARAAKPAVKAGKSAARDENVVEFEGFAPDDMHVAEVISRLSDSRLFESVVLRYSREIERDGLVGRKFKLRTAVSLSKAYVLPKAEREVAYAD